MPLNFLKAFNLHEKKSVVKTVTIIKTTVNKENGDSSGGGQVKSMTDTTEVTNVVMDGARKGRNLFGEREIRIKDESTVPEVESKMNRLCARE